MVYDTYCHHYTPNYISLVSLLCVCVCHVTVTDRLKPISVDSFRDHVNKMHEERDKGFEAEYQVIPHSSLPAHVYECVVCVLVSGN